MNSPTHQHCSLVVPALRERNGQLTDVLLSGGRTVSVYNIAWGQDLGDDFEHVTTNISPGIGGATVDMFFTDEIEKVVAPETGAVIWRSDGTPTVR
jgi:hypothetical protein